MKSKTIHVVSLALTLFIIASCSPSASSVTQNTPTPEPSRELWVSSTIVDANSVFKIDQPGKEGYIDREIPGGGILANKDTHWKFSIQVDLNNGGSGNTSAGVLLIGQSLDRTEATLFLVHNGNNWSLGYRPDPAGDYKFVKGLDYVQSKEGDFQISLTSGGRSLEVRYGTARVYSYSFREPLFRSDTAVIAYTENGPHSSVSVTSLVIEQNDLSDLAAYVIPERTSTPEPTSTPVNAPTRWPPVFQDSGFVSDHTLYRSQADSDQISFIAFSPDGRTFTTVGGYFVIWDAPTGIKLAARQDSYSYRCVTYSPDGKLIAAGAFTGSSDTAIFFYDADSSALLRTTKIRGDGTISLAFSPDGKILASGMRASSIILWDVASGNFSRTLYGHTADVDSLAFSPDGKILASGSTDNTIILWDTTTWKPIRTLKGHTNSVWSLLFLSDGKTLISGARDGLIILWDVTSGEQIATLDGDSPDIRGITLSPDERILASGSFEGRIVLWDIANRVILQSFQTGIGWMGLAFSPDGRTLASSDFSNIYLWKVVQ